MLTNVAFIVYPPIFFVSAYGNIIVPFEAAAHPYGSKVY